MLKAIRGAVRADRNDKENISKVSLELFDAVMSSNNLKNEDIVCVIFSCTSDINAYNPATAVRLNRGKELSFMCMQEAQMQNALSMCIRIMVLAQVEGEITNSYLGETAKLRSEK